MKTNEIVLSILLKGTPTNADYLATIENVAAVAGLAAEMLLNRQPANHELLAIMRNVTAHRRAAWVKLLEQHPTNGEIIHVIERMPDLRDEAWEQLQKQSPTNAELISIINTVDALQISTWQLLATRLPDEAELLSIYEYHCSVKKPRSPLRIPIATALLNLNCQKSTLLTIIHREEGLREMAVAILFQRSPSKEEMKDVLQYVTQEVREQICATLMASEPSLVDMIDIVVWSEILRDQVAERLLADKYDGHEEYLVSWIILVKCPTFRDLAFERCLATRRDACDLWNFHNAFSRENLEGTSFEKRAAIRFLEVAAGDQNWKHESSKIREWHPELKDDRTKSLSLAGAPVTRRGRQRQTVQ